MATLTISVPDQVKDLIDAQLETGDYVSTDQYIRDLVERDHERSEHDRRLEELRAIVDEGLNGPVSTRTSEERFAEAERIAKLRGTWRE